VRVPVDRRDQEELYRRIGLGQSAVGGDPRSIAVLLVDFQRLFTEGPYATPETGKTLEHAAKLLGRAREAGVRVFYVRVVYDEPDEAGVVWSVKSPAVRTALRGSPAVEIDPRVATSALDRVLDKKRASAFFGTTLHSELQELGVTTLLVAGTSTSGCVRATVVDACSLDYRTLVVRECVEDRAELSGELALFDIASKYGDVISLDAATALLAEAIALLDGAAARGAQRR
jgi:maleamate amidohydrolase